jgi:hypothetical protein
MTPEQTDTPTGSSESSVMHTPGDTGLSEQPSTSGRRHNPTRSFLLEGVVAIALVAVLTAGFALSSQSNAAPAPLLLVSRCAHSQPRASALPESHSTVSTTSTQC